MISLDNWWPTTKTHISTNLLMSSTSTMKSMLLTTIQSWSIVHPLPTLKTRNFKSSARKKHLPTMGCLNLGFGWKLSIDLIKSTSVGYRQPYCALRTASRLDLTLDNFWFGSWIALGCCSHNETNKSAVADRTQSDPWPANVNFSAFHDPIWQSKILISMGPYWPAILVLGSNSRWIKKPPLAFLDANASQCFQHH